MNKKVSFMVPILSLLMLFVAAAPAMAKPATKVEASTELILSIDVLPPPEVHITPSGVVHIRGANYVNSRMLYIGDDEYEVYVEGSYDAVGNPKTGTLIAHFTAVWYVGSLTGPTDDGFSGNQKTKVLNYNPVTEEGGDTTAHLVFQGFGSFAQYTLKLDYEGPFEGSTDPSGYCIIP
jgi:hypothetical protein